jgi:GTP-binding protein
MLKIKSAKLFKSAYKPEDIPETPYKEVFLAGRSNVGKSSLINTLTNNYKLAKVSSKPGKTTSINFYLINKRFFLVDLPGYGFASAPKAEKERWKILIDYYFNKSSSIKGSLLIIDARTGISESDKTMMKWLKFRNIKYYIVATKLDKLPNKEKDLATRKLTETLLGENIIFFSANTREGKNDVIKAIEDLLND